MTCCGGWMASWMGLWWVLLVVILGAGVVILIRVLDRSGARSHRSDAVTILEERYARGEIGREEFEERRSRLH